MREDDLMHMVEYFMRNDFIEVSAPELADILLMNTCAFDKEREEECLQLVREYKDHSGKLVITGCLGEISKKKMDKVFRGHYIPPPEIKNSLDRIVNKIKFPYKEIKFHGREKELYDCGVGWRKQTRPENIQKCGAVKIVNGCPMNCTYCTHRIAIGFKAESVPFEIIEITIETQVKDGAKVIQLLGDNLGPYGSDIKSNVPDLISRLSIRFPNISFALDQYHAAFFIRDYPQGLRDLIHDQKIYELKMPIQSGCGRVLKAMNRITNLEKLNTYVQEAVALAPDMLFVTHIITGFPTETVEEHYQSIEYIKRTFNHNTLIYIFPCFVHPETPAWNLTPHVKKEIAMARALEAETEFKKHGIDVCLDHLDVLKSRRTSNFKDA